MYLFAGAGGGAGAGAGAGAFLTAITVVLFGKLNALFCKVDWLLAV